MFNYLLLLIKFIVFAAIPLRNPLRYDSIIVVIFGSLASNCDCISLFQNMPRSLHAVNDSSHGRAAVNKDILAAFENNIAVMRANELVFEEYDRILAIVTNAGGSSKDEILLTLEFAANDFKPCLLCKLLKKSHANAD